MLNEVRVTESNGPSAFSLGRGLLNLLTTFMLNKI